MQRHYRYSYEVASSEGPKRMMRLACSEPAQGSDALKYSDICPSSITCKRCLNTWVVRHHIAGVLNIDPASKTMQNVIARYAKGEKYDCEM